MRVGVRWDFDLDEYTILDDSDYRAHSRIDIPAHTATWAGTLGLAHEHGGPFGYCSLANDVLGWVPARAGGAPFAALLSECLWSAIGAEADAEIIIDHNGFAIVGRASVRGCATSGRLGLMWLQDALVRRAHVRPLGSGSRGCWSAGRT
jgi:CubicO group peptidase (beta-lactamase class C family)